MGMDDAFQAVEMIGEVGRVDLPVSLGMLGDIQHRDVFARGEN